MILYSIVASAQRSAANGIDPSLERACQTRGIEYKRLIAEEVILDDIRNMDIAGDSLLYRMSTSNKARSIEGFLDTFHGDKLTSIYYPRTITYPPYASDMMRDFSRQMSEKLEIIPTSIVDDTWLSMTTEELSERVQALGGFPIIMKTLGLSHGRGVEKIDNIMELQSGLADKVGNYQVVLRKYLADYRHYRLIVVDNKVIAAIEYHKPADDFRTNAVETPHVSAVAVTDLSEEMSAIALKSVELRSSLLGGVDILVDQESGLPLLAEVNVPCYYPRAEGPTGIDISGLLVDALLRKQKEEKI